MAPRIEYKMQIIIVDAGIKFPEGDLLGIDYVIPTAYISENIDHVKAVLIPTGTRTISADIPFLLKQANVPIYTGPFGLVPSFEQARRACGLLRRCQTLAEINQNTEHQFKHPESYFLPMTLYQNLWELSSIRRRVRLSVQVTSSLTLHQSVSRQTCTVWPSGRGRRSLPPI